MQGDDRHGGPAHQPHAAAPSPEPPLHAPAPRRDRAVVWAPPGAEPPRPLLASLDRRGVEVTPVTDPYAALAHACRLASAARQSGEPAVGGVILVLCEPEALPQVRAVHAMLQRFAPRVTCWWFTQRPKLALNAVTAEELRAWDPEGEAGEAAPGPPRDPATGMPLGASPGAAAGDTARARLSIGLAPPPSAANVPRPPRGAAPVYSQFISGPALRLTESDRARPAADSRTPAPVAAPAPVSAPAPDLAVDSDSAAVPRPAAAPDADGFDPSDPWQVAASRRRDVLTSEELAMLLGDDGPGAPPAPPPTPPAPGARR